MKVFDEERRRYHDEHNGMAGGYDHTHHHRDCDGRTGYDLVCDRGTGGNHCLHAGRGDHTPADSISGGIVWHADTHKTLGGKVHKQFAHKDKL